MMTNHATKILRLVGEAGEFGLWRGNHEGASMRRLIRENLVRSRWHHMPFGAKEMVSLTDAGRRKLSELEAP